jgi:hypothetical protein
LGSQTPKVDEGAPNRRIDPDQPPDPDTVDQGHERLVRATHCDSARQSETRYYYWLHGNFCQQSYQLNAQLEAFVSGNEKNYSGWAAEGVNEVSRTQNHQR